MRVGHRYAREYSLLVIQLDAPRDKRMKRRFSVPLSGLTTNGDHNFLQVLVVHNDCWISGLGSRWVYCVYYLAEGHVSRYFGDVAMISLILSLTPLWIFCCTQCSGTSPVVYVTRKCIIYTVLWWMQRVGACGINLVSLCRLQSFWKFLAHPMCLPLFTVLFLFISLLLEQNPFMLVLVWG